MGSHIACYGSGPTYVLMLSLKHQAHRKPMKSNLLRRNNEHLHVKLAKLRIEKIIRFCAILVEITVTVVDISEPAFIDI